jgi:hypothetical protein
MRKAIAFLTIFSLLAIYASSQTSQVETRQDPPADFVGNGCTLWPDGNYRSCCEAHDRDYYRGGTGAERRASDKRLRDCVRGKGHKYLAPLVYLGVRIGGVSWLPTSFRWGFGQKRADRKDQKD